MPTPNPRDPIWTLRAQGVALRDAGVKSQDPAAWLSAWDDWLAQLLAALADYSPDLAHRLVPLDLVQTTSPREHVQFDGAAKAIYNHQLNIDAASTLLQLLVQHLMEDAHRDRHAAMMAQAL